MSLTKCLFDRKLTGKINVKEIRDATEEYKTRGMTEDAATIRAVEEHIDGLHAQERKIIAAVRAAYDADTGRPSLQLKAQSKSDLEAKDTRAKDQAIADKETADKQRDGFSLSMPEGTVEGESKAMSNKRQQSLIEDEDIDRWFGGDALFSKASKENVHVFRDRLLEKYPDAKIDLYPSGDVLSLSRIVVPKELRNEGIGTKIMQDIIAYADATGKRIVLTPSADFGGTKSRLIDFYKNLGFVENKGRNRNFTTQESMYRDPDPLASKGGGERRGGMSVEEVSKATQTLRAKWIGFKNVKVVQDAADLPAAIRERVQVDARTEAFYDPQTNTVHLIASNIATPERAAWVASHETIAHAGLRALGDKSVTEAVNIAGKNRFIGELAKSIAEDRGTEKNSVEEAVAELSAAIETNDFNALERRYGVAVPEASLNGVKGSVARVIEAVKRFIAKVMGKPVEEVPNAAIRDLIGQARAAVEGKGRESFDGRNEPALSSEGEVTSALITHMRAISEDGMVKADDLMKWIEPRKEETNDGEHASLEALTHWLGAMGDGQVSTGSVRMFLKANDLPLFSTAPRVDPERDREAATDRLSKYLKHPKELMTGMKLMTVPMSEGSDVARKVAKDWANQDRLAQDQWKRFDEVLTSKFTEEQLTKMWEAADEENDLRRDGVTDPNRGLNKLTEKEREAVETLHAYGEELLARAQESGMFKGEGVPYWAPRMAVMIGEDGEVSRLPSKGGAGGGGNYDGRNVNTNASSLKQRKYLTSAETEAAATALAQANGGEKAELIKNIRTMPMAMARLERAIAARELVNQIKALGQATGRDTVAMGAAHGNDQKWFTLDHPALKTYQPQMEEVAVTPEELTRKNYYVRDGQVFRRAPDAEGHSLEHSEPLSSYKVAADGSVTQMKPMLDKDGQPVMVGVPMKIAMDFYGPLKSILSEAPKHAALDKAYLTAMQLKSKTMGLIMYSPIIHNAVEWGRAVPTMLTTGSGNAAKNVMTLGAYTYFVGNRAKHDESTRREAILAGLVPIGGRSNNLDITGLSDNPDMKIGKSWTAQVLAAPVSLISERGATAVKKAVDAAGKFWHETMLWDRVGDLQFGLYTAMKTSMLNKGLSESDAAHVAAHFANRYAGALPRESMSEGSRRLLNLALFSRSFTMGNLGAMKDMTGGLPKDVQSQIKLSSGELALQAATSAARKKAIAAFIIDVGLMYIGNSLMQDWLRREEVGGWQGWADGYKDRAGAVWDKVKADPLHMLQHPFNTLESLTSNAENEPGKENRIKWGVDQDGTQIYMRLPTGKIGEEFASYADFPTGTMKTAKAKMSTFLKPLYETFQNDQGFGRKVYDDSKDASTMKNVGKVVGHFMAAQIPYDQIVSAYDLAKGKGDDMDVRKIVGPFVGLTFSKGAPGGPAVGEMYAEQREHQDKVTQVMPDVRRALKYGDEDKARTMLEDAGMTPKEINSILRHQEDPASRLSKNALKKFNQHATDEQRARMDKARN